MKEFEFRLETVLKVRKQEEAMCRRELVEEELLLRDRQERVDTLERETHDTENALRKLQEKGGKADDLAAHLVHLYAVQEQTMKSQDDLFRQKNATEKKRRAVAEAQKKKKMIENLREKSYLEWKVDVEQRETKNLDEIATQRHSRKGEGI